MARNDLTILVRMKDLATRGFLGLSRVAGATAKGISRSFQGILGLVTKLESALLGLGAPLLAFFTVAKFKELANQIDEAAKNARRFGVTTESYLEMAHAAELSGVNTRELAVSMRTMRRQAEEAVRGNRTMSRAFQDLGIDAEALQAGNLDLTEALANVGDAMLGIENASERVQVAYQIFGRSGTQMLTLFEQGGDGIRAMADEANRLGIVIGQESAGQFERFNDALVKITRAIQGVVIGLAEKFLPRINQALENFANLVAAKRLEIIDELAKMVRGVGEHFDKLVQLFALFAQYAEVKLQSIIIVFQSVDNLIKTGNAVLKKLTGTQAEYLEALRSMEESGARLMRSHSRLWDVLGKDPGEFVDRFRALRAEILKLADDASKAAAAVQELDRGKDPGQRLSDLEKFLAGADSAFESTYKRWTDTAALGRSSVTTLAQGIEQSMTTAFSNIILGTEKASDAFKSMGKAILATLAQVIAKLIVTALLTAAITGIAGLTGITLPTAAAPAPGPAALGGGAGAPASLPSSLAGEGGLVGPQGAGGGESTSVNVTIVANDSKGFDRLLSERRGTIEQIVGNAIRTKRSVRRDIARA